MARARVVRAGQGLNRGTARSWNHFAAPGFELLSNSQRRHRIDSGRPARRKSGASFAHSHALSPPAPETKGAGGCVPGGGEVDLSGLFLDFPRDAAGYPGPSGAANHVPVGPDAAGRGPLTQRRRSLEDRVQSHLMLSAKARARRTSNSRVRTIDPRPFCPSSVSSSRA